MANSTDDNKLINAGSPALHGVDHSTGKFCSFISIAQLIGNNGLGPSLDLKLYYTPHIEDDYFGNWRFGFNCATVYNTLASRAEILLESGQVIKWDGRSEATLPNTLIKVQSNNLHIIQSNGRREVLSPFPDPLDKHLISYLPTKIISESGHELTLDWTFPTPSLPGFPAGNLQLTSIRDESKTLFTATYATNTQPSSITLNVWPGTSSNYNYILDVSTLSVPGAPQKIKTLDKAVRSDSSDKLEFSYIRLARPNRPYPDGTPRAPTSLALLNKIKHGNRFSESITYNEEKVSSHTIEYINLRTSVTVQLHPTSALYGLGFLPDYVIYHELILTSKEYMSTVTSVDPHWLADLGGVFYSVKEKGYSAREKRITETEFNRKMEIEAQMAVDRQREQDRLKEEEELKLVKKPSALAKEKKTVTSGAVVKPARKRAGRGF